MTNEPLYLDYWNNFLTVDAFAEHYGYTLEQANEIINAGRMENMIKTQERTN